MVGAHTEQPAPARMIPTIATDTEGATAASAEPPPARSAPTVSTERSVPGRASRWTVIGPTAIAAANSAGPRAHRSAPVARLEHTTAAEKNAYARLSSGWPDASSSRTASALIATSIAAEAAPRRNESIASRAGESASRGSTAVTPNAATETGVSRGPVRSMRTPVARVETSAPIASTKSAAPRSASLAPDRRCTAGSAAPHEPQKTPNAANPTSARVRGRSGAREESFYAPERPAERADDRADLCTSTRARAESGGHTSWITKRATSSPPSLARRRR